MKARPLIILGLLALALVIAAYFYPLLPESMASHWNAAGEVNGWMPKFELHLLIFGLLGFMALLFSIIPRIDPLKKNLEQFINYYWGIVYIFLGFMIYVYLLTAAANLGMQFNMNFVLMPAMAVLFFYLGIVMEKSKRNWFVGIRTPWTLSSDKVWEETHKLGAKVFKILAFVFLLMIIAPAYAFPVLIAAILIGVFGLVIYSYWAYRKYETK